MHYEIGFIFNKTNKWQRGNKNINILESKHVAYFVSAAIMQKCRPDFALLCLFFIWAGFKKNKANDVIQNTNSTTTSYSQWLHLCSALGLGASGGPQKEAFTSSEACLERPTFNTVHIKKQSCSHRSVYTSRCASHAAMESNDEYLPCMAAKVAASPLSQFANL